MATMKFKYRPPPGLLTPEARAPEPAPKARETLPPPEEIQRLDPFEKVDRWWYESSWDLRRGLDVCEVDNTVPGDLLEELFKDRLSFFGGGSDARTRRTKK